ncbi:unnamed protein product [Dicrocoelium dendriticum]|nr:unnamed protein product [Dicrocoelium dendriticum]
MVVRALLIMGAAYLRRIRGLPRIIYRVPKNLQPQLIKAPAQKYSYFRSPRLLKYLRGFAGRDSLASIVRKSVTASSTYKRPGSLIRAYSGLAGSVHLRHQIGIPYRSDFTPINELSKPPEQSWISGFLSSINRFPTLPNFSNQIPVLAPKELIGTGCNSAVWAADLESCEDGDGANNELAVKVLYNYYAAFQVDSFLNNGVLGKEVDNTAYMLDQSVNWVLLHRQLERECGLRPPLGHPNIVPLVGHFVARAPTSHGTPESLHVLPETSPDHEIRGPHHAYDFSISGDWKRADEFAEGFGGRPLTYYLLMPRFQSTLDELLSGAWHPPITKDSRKEAEDRELFSTDSSNGRDVAVEPEKSPISSSDSSDPIVLSSSLQNVGNEASSRDSPPCHLDPDEAVAILAQLFDAVAELERLGVSHRDIKGNNILLRLRTPPQMTHFRSASRNVTPTACLAWLDNKEASLLNTRFHVAITDFGCAVRTRVWNPDDTWSSFFRFLDHMFGPDLTQSRMDVLTHSGNSLLLAPEIASRLWSTNAEASLELSGTDYAKADLWALSVFDRQLLDELQRYPIDEISESLMNRLVPLLSECWAADWLTGAARPPDGLRVSFYRRITPRRWAKCLLIVYHAEAERGDCIAEHIVWTISTSSSSTPDFSLLTP